MIQARISSFLNCHDFGIAFGCISEITARSPEQLKFLVHLHLSLSFKYCALEWRSYGCFVKSQMEHGSFRCTVVLFLDQLQTFQLALFALLSKWILLKSVRN